MSEVKKIVNPDNLITCEECGCVEDTLYEIDGKYVCEDCLREMGYAICEDCGEVFPIEEMHETHTGLICDECSGDYYVCDDCGKYVSERDIHEVSIMIGWRYDTKYVCDNCLEDNDDYIMCEHCGDWFDSSEIGYEYVNGVGYVCNPCLSDHYYQCADCGEWFCDDDVEYNEDEDEYYCHSCARDHDQDDSKCHPYSYKPEPKFLTHDTSKAYNAYNIDAFTYGCENEVDKGDYDEIADTIREISEACPDVYMKHDGSLDEGFEIVTHPATLEYHMKDFKWRQICQIAKDHGFKSHDARTCGLHVHVGRYQLGTDEQERTNTIANILLMVDRHWDVLVKFSRRRESQLHWAERPQLIRPVDGDTEETARRKALHADNGNRYQAVNLCNHGTIEFRIFNGTLKRDTIIATIQLLDNLCHYAKEHSTAECLASKWEDITGYAHYDELDTYLRDRGIVKADDPDAVDVYDPEETTAEEIAERKFSEGDMVVVVDGPYRTLLRGMTGRVVVPDSRRTNVGIYFPTYEDGHSLDGNLSGDDAYHGWWVRPEHLALAS